jgi:hypothetical protein
MTGLMDERTGTLSCGGGMGGQGKQMADKVGSRLHPTLDGARRNSGKHKKRRREVAKAQDDSYSSFPAAKKARTDNLSSQSAALEHGAPTQDTTGILSSDQEDHAEIETQLPSALKAILLATYEVHNMKVISSSKIQAKVSTIIETLGSFSFVATTKPNIVLLHAKGPVSSKLISIIEIVKREIAKAGGKWYQYNFLGQILAIQEEKPAAMNGTGFTLGGKIKGDTESMELDDKEDSQNIEEGDDTFETMKTPLERAIEGKPKVHVIPVMAVFLSRVRIDALKTAYG